MNPSGPELRDIHLPADPSWWPPAPGWWILSVLALGLLFWAALHVRRRLREHRWRQRILAELESIASRQTIHPDAVELAGDISRLLRRASRLIDPAASALRGDKWLEFLDATLATTEFSQGVGRVILEGPYQKHTSLDATALIDLARRWLTRVVNQQARHV